MARRRSTGSRVRRWLWVMVCAAGGAAAFGGFRAAAAAPELTDRAIADAVEDRLDRDPGVFAGAIDVGVEDGIVTLAGRTDNVLARDRAERIAMLIKGVRAVVDRIEVRPLSPRSDDAVRDDVRAALREDPATEAFQVVPTVEDGRVTLTGSVDTWGEWRLARQVAEGVRGVTGVENKLTVAYTTPRGDAEIRHEIEEALRRDVLVDAGLVTVAVDGGAVRLGGTVGSAAEKARVRFLAWTAGVTAVDASGLKVARWARDDALRRHKYPVKGEGALLGDVAAALHVDPRVSRFDVAVEVDGAEVTLRGTVDSVAARRAAARDARDTVGVTAVRNRLKVRPAGSRTDREVAEAVLRALGRDPYLQRDEVTATVHGGIVELRGRVDTYFERVQADEVASRVAGVVAVNNRLAVVSPAPYPYDPYLDRDRDRDQGLRAGPEPSTGLDDDRIREAIEAQLFWSPFVDGNEVSVAVEDGVATLTGRVDTWAERAAAEGDAYRGGAVRVRNRLHVRY